MIKTYFWRSPASVLASLVLLSSGTIPLLTATPIQAQNSNQVPSIFQQPATSTTNAVIPVGTRIPVMSEEAEKILLKRNETMAVTLQVAANIRDRDGRILIPYGSKITGQLEPTTRGTRFVAEELVWANGRTQEIAATSNAVTRTETINKGTDVGQIATRAAIGAGAAAAISVITGGGLPGTGELLLGAGLGALSSVLLGGGNSVEVVSINPSTDLDLTLSSRLALNN